ncbi:thrombospondin type-1 domain-containing protein 7B-like [Ciona intestinalis]
MRLLFAVIAVLALVLLFCEGGEAWWRRRRRRRPSPVDCSVSAWTHWSRCSKTCGGGFSVKTRYVTRWNAHGGRGCPALRQTQYCYIRRCPVSCLVSGWSSWGSCSRTCGVGQAIKTRTITRHAAYGGARCPTLRQSKYCHIRICPVHCLVSGWASWGTCSRTCGSGQNIRSRVVTRNAAYGGASCPVLREKRTCHIRKCPVHCRVSGWSRWGSCSRTCGVGQAIKTRTITRHAAYGGARCPALKQSKACNKRICPVHCRVTGWASWGTCSRTCGLGQNIRSRVVTRNAAYGGASCPVLREKRTCHIRKCPVHCLVSSWASWGTCSKTCGLGKTIRLRTITIHPAHGGLRCLDLSQNKTCQTKSCPVLCAVSGWTGWSACSKTCGKGFLVRSRHITRNPAHGAPRCPTLRQFNTCHMAYCPVSCKVSKWSGWESCSKTCGLGQTVRSRTITRYPAHEGARCPVLRHLKTCLIKSCPVNCQVSGWTAWDACSKTCGEGVSNRTRNITSHPVHGGRSCPHLQQTKACNIKTCPLACLVSKWSNWTTCSKTCDVGQSIRLRHITRNPAFGAHKCPPLRQTRDCHIKECPGSCRVGKWTDWGTCSKSCGSGQTVRTRAITRHPSHGGSSCPTLRESKACNIRTCPVPCLVSNWNSWTTCSKTCDVGQSFRLRHITQNSEFGAPSCPHLRQTKDCHIRPCSPCLVSNWNSWTTCSETCGVGQSFRLRHITSNHANGALGCPVLQQTKKCYIIRCLRNCPVSDWGHWSGCSKTCGGGQATRKRNITKIPQHTASGCPALSETKACYTQACPVPITCKWSTWGVWSSCDPCFSGGRSRSRNVSVPAMFNGPQCSGSRAKSDYSCTAAQACKETECSGRKFACVDGLGCIPKRFKCNGDNDCTDFSDEENCPAIRSPCRSRKYEGIPNIDIVGAGFDITKLQEEGTIMDNQQYNGRCSIVRSGGKRYRKPANFPFYKFQVRAKAKFLTKSYDSSMTYFQDERASFESKLDAGVSLTYTSILSLSKKSVGSNSEKTKMVINFGTDSDSKFFKISNTVEVAQFRIARRKLFLSYDLLQRLKELPNYFDYAKYSQIISDFGTHFYSNGRLGGRYEYTYRYSKKELKKSGLTDMEQKSCLMQEAKASFKGISGGLGNSKCSLNALSQKHKGSFTRAATNFVSNVVGGTSEKAAALSFFSGKTPNKSDYDEWVKTVKQNPAVIDYKLSPISSAVPLSTSKKRINLERALDLYLKEYDFSKCMGKCAHGAAVVVVNGGKLCKCLCPANYGGIDCNVRA